MDRKRYPPNWKEIALKVKEDADWKCQNCGMQCRRPNEPFDTHKRTLTVAHLNHTPEDCRPENLRAWCSACHLRYDAKHHAETRRKKKMLNKNAPVICAECDKAEIRGRDLYCTEKQRIAYGSKPKWCPFPVWNDDVIEGQMSIFDYQGQNQD